MSLYLGSTGLCPATLFHSTLSVTDFGLCGLGFREVDGPVWDVLVLFGQSDTEVVIGLLADRSSVVVPVTLDDLVHDSALVCGKDGLVWFAVSDHSILWLVLRAEINGLDLKLAGIEHLIAHRYKSRRSWSVFDLVVARAAYRMAETAIGLAVSEKHEFVPLHRAQAGIGLAFLGEVDDQLSE